MNIPVVETARLLLRPFRLEDFERLAAMWADPAVVRHMGDGTTRSEETAWSGFLRGAGQWAMRGFGPWAIEEKAGGALIGNIGYIDRKRDRGPEYEDVLEIGWMLAPASWGKGYATEALQAALRWGRMHFGPVRVIALTAPENIASMRVAQKCGFAEQARILSLGRPRVVLGRVL
ncbi:MAG: GNAT family N-acetyltransferase [Alphaproteobacteria bacterium]|nr:GNAT family N-acetyltransferase [Alphaproteobacteria bacterium]MDE2113118.1 GNAT family N-acetyltransferase [Alphaproteobacteria bacterium]MDE2493725.1 GNAT family N-acetyltransferase [Alphaproteobacteria bacterium]